MDESRRTSLSRPAIVLFGCALIALALTPLSSELPDGLEFTAQTLEFDEHARTIYGVSLSSALGDGASALAGAALAAATATACFLALGKFRKRHFNHGTLRDP